MGEMKNVPIYQSQGKCEIQNERSRCGQVVVMVVGKGTCGVTWMRRRLFYISTTGCTASTCTSTCTASTCANTQSELHRSLDAPSPLKHFYIWMRRFTTVCANVLDDAPPLLLLAVLLLLFFVGIFLLKPGIIYPYLGYNVSILMLALSETNNQKFD